MGGQINRGRFGDGIKKEGGDRLSRSDQEGIKKGGRREAKDSSKWKQILSYQKRLLAGSTFIFGRTAGGQLPNLISDSIGGHVDMNQLLPLEQGS